MTGKTRKNPATARFAREKLEKELEIRFLAGRINHFRMRLGQIILLHNGQRDCELQNLLSELIHLDDVLSDDVPVKNMSKMARRKCLDIEVGK